MIAANPEIIVKRNVSYFNVISTNLIVSTKPKELRKNHEPDVCY